MTRFVRAMCLLLAIGPVTAACSKSADSGWVSPATAAEGTGDPLTIKGTVKHSELEGGFYYIEAADGTKYSPTNLPPEFQKDGTAVDAEMLVRKDMMGVNQVGPIVDIVRIRATS